MTPPKIRLPAIPRRWRRRLRGGRSPRRRWSFATNANCGDRFLDRQRHLPRQRGIGDLKRIDTPDEPAFPPSTVVPSIRCAAPSSTRRPPPTSTPMSMWPRPPSIVTSPLIATFLQNDGRSAGDPHRAVDDQSRRADQRQAAVRRPQQDVADESVRRDGQDVAGERRRRRRGCSVSDTEPSATTIGARGRGRSRAAAAPRPTPASTVTKRAPPRRPRRNPSRSAGRRGRTRPPPRARSREAATSPPGVQTPVRNAAPIPSVS